MKRRVVREVVNSVFNKKFSEARLRVATLEVSNSTFTKATVSRDGQREQAKRIRQLQRTT